MMLIRPATSADLNSLFELANKTGPGLTTLPSDMDILEAKIESSIKSFNRDIKTPALEYYLFLLEDTETGKVVGTSALAATVGLDEAFYTYHLGTVVHTSEKLNVHNVINALYLGNDYTGTTEICTLFLDPDYRKDGNGQLLSRCRFLFMAMNQERFAPKVIAEMRGVSDSEGNSPFWDAVGRHFFSMSFPDADAVSGEGQNQFIAELMPKYPIYLPLLPKEARDVIGKTHPDTKPALKMLENEGFEYRGYVDIFDAGPSIEVKTQNIRSIRKSTSYNVIIDEAQQDDSLTAQFFLGNQRIVNFRSCYGQAIIKENNIIINQTLANTLKVDTGDTLRALATGR
ncbi:MAG: arginine N-succinyltransferase [Enterobacterales bacterium]|jgi:arginine N-succinyltransferase